MKITTTVEARKAIRNHRGIITTAIAGMMEWSVIITKKEAIELTKQVDLNEMAIAMGGNAEELSLGVFEVEKEV